MNYVPSNIPKFFIGSKYNYRAFTCEDSVALGCKILPDDYFHLILVFPTGDVYVSPNHNLFN